MLQQASVFGVQHSIVLDESLTHIHQSNTECVALQTSDEEYNTNQNIGQTRKANHLQGVIFRVKCGLQVSYLRCPSVDSCHIARTNHHGASHLQDMIMIQPTVIKGLMRPTSV